MTAVDVDALAKLREAATPGPWERSPLYQEEVWGARGLNRGRHRVAPVDTEADAALIVAAVNALEPLLAEVRRGRALRERLEGLAQSWEEGERGGWVPAGRGAEVGRARDSAHAVALRAVVAAVDAS